MAKPMDFSKEGILKALGWGGLIAAATGPEGVLQEGIATALGGIDSMLQKVAPKFVMNANDFTVFGSIKYWDEILGKVKEANQKLGIETRCSIPRNIECTSYAFK